jgi:hypothetical protein
MPRASIPALARVVRRLGVVVDWACWARPPPGAAGTGTIPSNGVGRASGRASCAAGRGGYEPLLVHRASLPHPYWPGGAVLVEPGADPRAIGLLDDLAEDLLH